MDKVINLSYREAFTKYIVKPLREYGFKRYKSTYVARIVGDSIFQFINFQKEAYGSNTFTVNIGIRPLYVFHEYLTLRPGNRLGYFKYEKDTWWSFKDECSCNNSFKEVKEILIDKIIPLFDKIVTTEHLIELYSDLIPNIELPTSESWREYDLAFIYLKNNNVDIAIQHFKKAERLFYEDGRKWAIEAGVVCRDLQKSIMDNFLDYSNFLIEEEMKTRKSLKLITW